MPYSRSSGRLESARSLGHVPLVESPFIQQRLESYKSLSREFDTPISSSLLTSADELPSMGPSPTWVLAFDGSLQEVATQEQYPSTRIGYIQVAGVLVNLNNMISEGYNSLVDPSIVRSCIQESLHSIAMPSSNVCRKDCSSIRDSWRAEVYDVFHDYRVEDTPLLDTLAVLVAYSGRYRDGDFIVSRCSASDDCGAREIPVPKSGGICPECGGTLYPTDILRIHEEVSLFNSNATPLGRLMSTLEHITLVAYIDFLFRRQPRSLSGVAFILDGPLALFGPQAWLHTSVWLFLRDVYGKLAGRQLRMPVVVGIEKTGHFAEHALAIQERIGPRFLMKLPDDYIYERILAARERPDTRYGRDEYYGRKFFYRTAQRKVLTISIPPVVDPSSSEAYDLGNYPSLSNTLSLLDQIGTNLYENAVIPIALAHSYAAIPLRTGSKVLTLLSKKVDSD
jgi:hypothetical protein